MQSKKMIFRRHGTQFVSGQIFISRNLNRTKAVFGKMPGTAFCFAPFRQMTHDKSANSRKLAEIYSFIVCGMPES